LIFKRAFEQDIKLEFGLATKWYF